MISVAFFALRDCQENVMKRAIYRQRREGDTP